MDGQGLAFNLSHSHELALFAFTINNKIGVDVEYINTDFQWRDVVERVFSSEEISAIQLNTEGACSQEFYSYWTRKEAVLKSIGKGLAIDPKDINVTKTSVHPCRVIQQAQVIDSTEQWSLLDLDPEIVGYAASLAVEGRDFNVKYWNWQ